MKARIVSERSGGLLVVRLRGSIGFDESDFQLRDELVALVGGHANDGGTHLLVDFSETRFVYVASLELGGLPLLEKKVVGSMRVAACFGTNKRARQLFRATRVDGWIDCFDTEAEALAFLRSGTPMTCGVADDHGFLDGIGPEVGPGRCKREGCDRLRVAYSLFCTPHHYEMAKGAAYAHEPGV